LPIFGKKIQKAFTTFNLDFIISLVAFLKLVLLLFRPILKTYCYSMLNASWDGKPMIACNIQTLKKMWISNHPQEDLAKFGYRSKKKKKVKFF
jgi:isoprenylcysteine carboxyl methyltransferase (ICMT) family protein YpbQ